MTPNLPNSLAQLIPPIFHAEAAAAYAASVEPLIASHVERAKDEMSRSIVAYVASYGLVEPPAEGAPAAPSKHIIAAGERGGAQDLPGPGEFLGRHNIPVIAEVDTRRLVRHLRTRGVMRDSYL